MDRCHFTDSLVYKNHLTFSSNKNPLLFAFKTSLPLHYLGTRCDLMDDSGSIVDSTVDQEIEFRFNLMLDSLEDWKVTINKKEHEKYSLSGEPSWKVRSSHRRCSVKECVHNKFSNFTGEYLCWSLCLIKFQTWRNFLNTSFEKHLRTVTSERYNIASGCTKNTPH